MDELASGGALANGMVSDDALGRLFARNAPHGAETFRQNLGRVRQGGRVDSQPERAEPERAGDEPGAAEPAQLLADVLVTQVHEENRVDDQDHDRADVDDHLNRRDQVRLEQGVEAGHRQEGDDEAHGRRDRVSRRDGADGPDEGEKREEVKEDRHRYRRPLIAVFLRSTRCCGRPSNSSMWSMKSVKLSCGMSS